MADKKCPRCGLWNIASALRCDCGYNFETEAVEDAYRDTPFAKADRGNLWSIVWGLNLLFGLLLLAWPIAVFGSIFAMDSPNQYYTPVVQTAVWSVWTYPVVYLIALVGSILVYRKNYHRESILFAALPIINVLGLFGWWINSQ